MDQPMILDYPYIVPFVIGLFLGVLILFVAIVASKNRDDALRTDRLEERMGYYIDDYDPTPDEDYELMESNGAVNHE